MTTSLESAPHPPASTMDAGVIEGDRIIFPNWRLPADGPAPRVPEPVTPDQRIGFAVMGLGRLSLGQILPALTKSKFARPVAVISGLQAKRDLVARQYGLQIALGYDEVHKLSECREVAAVFIATPNGLHLDNVRAVAKTGKAILLEKPMAANSAQALEIASICESAGVQLMVGYRSQFEPHMLYLRDQVQRGIWGKLKAMTSVNVQTAAPGNHWRYDRVRAGGGALPDIGIYCLSIAQFLSGETPQRVSAIIQQPPGDARFAQVEESCALTLEFPSGFVLQSFSSYGAREERSFKLMFEQATVTVNNAYSYAGLEMVVSRSGRTGISNEHIRLPAIDQFEAEIDYFADCIATGARPRIGPEQGIRDHLIMEAAYRSAANGKWIDFAA